ncbi:MAG: hypothetical protein P4L50_01795 [Anaerolineaceae bacterium]|nr:hypothetical protein [Anaerolineaceae bacterium]
MNDDSQSKQDGNQANANGSKPRDVVLKPSPSIENRESSDNTNSKSKKEKKSIFRRLKEWRSDPYRERASWTDKAIVLLTVGIVVLAGMQWKEMDDSGRQTDKIISAANLIEDHQKQLVTDNKTVLGENREALANVLKENREELAKALQQNRDALRVQTAAARDQSNAALQSAISIQRQTEISERPWMTIEASVLDDLTYSVNGGRFAFHFVLRNTGITPAVHASFLPQIVVLNPAVDIISETNRLCESLERKGQDGMLSDAYFPNDPQSKDFGIVVGRQEMSKVDGSMIPILISCVAYQSSFDSTWHYTAKIYEVDRYRPDAQGKFVFEFGVPIAKSYIGLSRGVYPEIAK